MVEVVIVDLIQNIGYFAVVSDAVQCFGHLVDVFEGFFGQIVGKFLAFAFLNDDSCHQSHEECLSVNEVFRDLLLGSFLLLRYVLHRFAMHLDEGALSHSL